MHTNELSLLRRICDANPRLSVHDLTPEERGMLSTLRRDGLITQSLDGFLLPRDTAFPALKEAEQRLSLDEALRAQEESFRQQLLQVQQQAAEALERTRNEFADYKAQQAKQHTRDEDQRILDRKQSTRNQLICSALSVCLTLFLEHLPDVIGFVDVLLKSALSLFHG